MKTHFINPRRVMRKPKRQKKWKVSRNKKSTCVFEGAIGEKTSIDDDVFKSSISKVAVGIKDIDISLIK
jgi:hypothetical protein